MYLSFISVQILLENFQKWKINRGNSSLKHATIYEIFWKFDTGEWNLYAEAEDFAKKKYLHLEKGEENNLVRKLLSQT